MSDVAYLPVFVNHFRWITPLVFRDEMVYVILLRLPSGLCIAVSFCERYASFPLCMSLPSPPVL